MIAANGGADEIFEGFDPGETDRLVLGTGLAPANLLVARSASNPNDMLLSFVGFTGSVLLHDEFKGANYGVEQVVFGDGTTWSRADLLKAFAADGATAGVDTLQGQNDQGDYLDGLGGDDFLIGGSGSDTYYWDPGDGTDTVDEVSNFVLDNGFDRLLLGSGVLPSGVTVERDMSDQATAVLRFSGLGGGVRLSSQQFADGTDHKVDQVVFADGTTWDRAPPVARPISATPARQATT